MATIAEQLKALAVLDSLKHASVPGSMTNLPWQAVVGSWNETTGWSPSSFLANEPTGTRSGLYINTGQVSGNYGLGLKKTTGSLATAGRQFEVWLFYQGGAKASGYQLRVLTESLTDKVKYVLRKFVEGEPTTLFESAKEQPFLENDSFFLARVGNKLAIYRRNGEGTPELIGSEVEDTTFTEGYVGFGGNGSNPKLVNLQGGALVVATEDDAHRYFTGTSETDGEYLGTSLGGFGGESARTVVALVKWDGQRGNILGAEEAAGLGGTDRILLSVSNLGDVQYVERTGGPVQIVEDEWYLIVGQKAAGTQKPKVHAYRFSTETWQHGEASEARSEQNPAGWNHFRIAGRVNSVGPYRGGIAAIAGYKSVLTEEQLQKLVDSISIENWLSLSPSPNIMWMFNQVEVTDEIEDLTGGGANQIERSGTAVVVDEPPIPYFGEESGAMVNVLVGGSIVAVKRWILVKGELVSV